MSGIFGVFRRNSAPVDQAALQPMQKVFAQWFSDGHGIWCGGSVGFGHNMLWNTPESRFEILPYTDVQGGHELVITADARLDNRSELLEKLGLSTPIDEITDSQLLLEAYRTWGEGSPKYLLGDFAYVIWDEREEKLFCARDHIGIKQFYFFVSEELFVFSNDVSAIKACALVPTELNKEAIAIYLQASPYISQNRTFYEFINKLEPASTLLVSGKNISRKIYWKAEESASIRFENIDDYVRHLRKLLDDAVRVRLRSAYPVISHLSGGLDSSAITVLAARALASEGKVPRVFNWAYMLESEKDLECIEWSNASRVAAEQNIPLEPILITPEFVKEACLGADITLYEQAYDWEEAIGRAKSVETGGRTILSGWGGDELISYGGYSHYSGLIRRGKFLHAYRLIYSNGRKSNLNCVKILKKCVRSTLYAFFSKTMSGLYKVEKDEDIFNVLRPEFAPVVRAKKPPVLSFQFGSHGEQIELFNHGHLTSRIECWGASGLRHAVEYRYPLLDRRIVEFALGVPEQLFEPRSGYSRFLFRSAIEDILPKEVVWAPKFPTPRHFEMRKGVWLAALGLLLNEEKSLFDVNQEFIDGNALYRIIEEIVAINSTDFEKVKNSGLVYPAIAVAVLNNARKSNHS